MNSSADKHFHSAGGLLNLGSLCLLILITYWIYQQAYAFEFISFDDPGYVYENPHLKEGLTRTSLKWAVTPGYLQTWHGLTWLSHLLDAQLFGMQPMGPHAINVGLHLLNCSLLYLLCLKIAYRLAPESRSRKITSWVAALWFTLLFALHPLNVESVAWVSERKNLLSTGFCLLACLAYLSYSLKPGGWGMTVVFFWMALGLWSKAILVGLPLVLLGMDFWPLRRFSPKQSSLFSLLREKIPLGLLSLTACGLTIMYASRGKALTTLNDHGLIERIGNLFTAYTSYLGMFFYPFNLAVYYPYPQNLPLWKLTLSILVFCSLSGMAWYWRSRRPWFAFGWCWFILTLLPVVGIVSAHTHLVADRYAYLSQPGLALMIGGLLWEAASRYPRLKIPLFAMTFIFILFCSLITTAYLPQWQNSLSLFSHAVKVDPRNHIAQDHLGDALRVAGRSEEAIWHHRKALQLKPDFAKAHNNLALALSAAGKRAEAKKSLQKCLELHPSYLRAAYNLAVLHFQDGELALAKNLLQQIIQHNPAMGEAHYYLGLCQEKEQRFGEAQNSFQEALKYENSQPDIWHSLGNSLGRQGRFSEAHAAYQRALVLKSDYQPSLQGIGLLYELQGATEKAIRQYQEILSRWPDCLYVLTRMADIMEQKGAKTDAEEYRKRIKALQKCE